MQNFLYRIQNNLVLVLCLFLGAVLLFANLGALPFWCDEAMTANVARNLSQSIVPRGWDGINIFVPREVVDSNFLVTLLPWLQHYLVFISFKLFGESNFTARLPFALFGLLSIPLLYSFAKYFVGKNIANLATVLFTFSVTFLVYSRNCRYYALTLFFGLLFFYTFLTLKKFKSWDNFLFILAGVLLFHSSYLVFTAISLTFLILFLLWNRDISKFKILLTSSLIIALFTLPWFFITERILIKDFFASGFVQNTIYLLLKNLKAFIGYGFFSLVLSAIFIVFMFLPQNRAFRREVKQPFLYISSAIGLYILISSFLQSYDYQQFPSRLPYIRISLILLPWFAVWNAIGFKAIAGYSRLVSYLLLALFLLTNIFSWPFPVKTQGVPINIPVARSFFYEYVEHLIDQPDGQAVSELADYLNKNAENGDIVFADQCWAYQLTWLLNNKLKFCCHQDITDYNNQHFMKLPGYCYSNFDQPDWVAISPFTFKANAREHMKRAFANINLNDYVLRKIINRRDFFIRPNFESFFMRGFNKLDLKDVEKTYIYKKRED